MGVHDFTKVNEPTHAEITLVKLHKEYPDDDFGVDAFPEMFRSTAMQHAAKLTNKAGEPTLHLTVALANAVTMKALGHENIWVFDSRDPRRAGDSKAKTLLDRAAVRKANLAELAKIEKEVAKLEKLAETVPRKELEQIDPTFDITLKAKREEAAMIRARNPNKYHFNKMIIDVMFILTKLGIQHAIAPPGCDAEKLIAQLCREGLIDGAITVDTDATVYGCPKQIKKVAGKSGKYDVYVLADILKRHDITRQQLAEVASVMGCDFCEKTDGVGAKTVVKKVKEGKIKYTDEQLDAQRRFMDETDVRYEFIDPVCSNASLNELRTWLIDVQGFGEDGVDKKLKPFYKK